MDVTEAVQQQQIDVTAPFTGETLRTITISTTEDVQAAAARARAAWPAWAARSVRERAHLLRAWTDLAWAEREHIIGLMQQEAGKTRDGGFSEILGADAVVQYYLRTAPRLLRPQKRRPLFPLVHRARVYHHPYGVAGFIAPWNYPYLLSFIDMIPALIAGNAALLKPSEITPSAAEYGIELMHRAGIPQDVVQVLHGDGSTGAALVDEVDYICFTGSTAVGRKVAARAGERLIPCSLELGGKDPAIVLRDADLDLAAARLLNGALENAGQLCISIERAYVEAPIYDALLERIRHWAGTIKLGPQPDAHVGSLTNQRELDRTMAHVRDAVEKGARVLLGGHPRPDLGPLFFEPTVLVDVDHTMDVMREESFGPLLPIMKVQDAEEALRLANDNPYGLAASVFTRSLRQGEALATRMQSGNVAVNRTSAASLATFSLPFSGFGESGLGARNGPEGLLRFVAKQSIVVENPIFQRPSVALLDPMSRAGYLTMRALRRVLPFI